MAASEDETYSTMFASLKHPVRRKILRMLAQKPLSFSEILEVLGISSSHLTYHLDNLGELISKTEKGKYKLSTFGEAAIATMSRVEEEPKANERKRTSSLPLKWKSLFAMLLIALVFLSGLSCIQYQSINRLTSEYDKLKELVELVETKQASLKSEHWLSFTWNQTEHLSQGSPFCFVYNPYDNSTLHLVLTISNLSKSHLAISVQDTSIFDLTTREAGAVIWSVHATANNTYSVQLFSKGWYIISLVGPIMKFKNAIMVSMEVDGDVDCRMSLRMTCEKGYAPFVVSPVYLFG